MHHRTALQLAVQFANAVDRAMLVRGDIPQTQREKLRTMAAEIIHVAERVGDTRAARAARSSNAAERARTEPFILEWRSTGRTEHVSGWQALAIRVGLSEASVRSRVSQGRGSFTRLLYDDEGGADNVTITRLKYVPGTGRPKHASE